MSAREGERDPGEARARHTFFFAAAPLPAPAAFFSTLLTTPTATVWRMSRTAKRPRGG